MVIQIEWDVKRSTNCTGSWVQPSRRLSLEPILGKRSPSNFLDSSLIPQKDVLKYLMRILKITAHCEQSTAIPKGFPNCKIFQVALKSRGRSSGMTTRQPWLGCLDGHVNVLSVTIPQRWSLKIDTF